MNRNHDSVHERYLVYPNESIDKVTVNRTFERLFNDIDLKTRESSPTVGYATEKSYGSARFSPSATYLFEEPSEPDENYFNSMLTIGQLKDMSNRLSMGAQNSLYVAALTSDSYRSGEISSYRYWVKSDYSDSKFTFMPNGVNVFTCRFSLGFNGLSNAIGDDSITDDDVTTPIALSGYTDRIDIDDESRWNIDDFINDNIGIDGYVDVSNVKDIENMDGRSIVVPFLETASVSLRHNDCNSTRYSAYRQSYIEVCMSMRLSVKSLFESKYGTSDYDIITESSEVTAHFDFKTDEPSRKYRLFTQKPFVMSQIAFFNNNSNPKPLFGFDNRIENDGFHYVVYDALSGTNVLLHDGAVISVGGVSKSIFATGYENIVNDRGSNERIAYFDYETSSDEPMFYFETFPQSGIVEEKHSSFSSHSQLSHTPLDEIDVGGNMVSPVKGSVIVKKIENSYDRDGNIIDNIIYFDVIMKFMAGSPSDPEMEYAMNSLNSRSIVQIAMIGV